MFLARGLQLLEHQLPGEVDIGAVLEDDGNYGQARLGNRADFFYVGQGVHRGLDGIGNQLFDFLGRQTRCFGIHLHLNVRHVRKGVEIQLLQREDRADQGGDQTQHREQAVPDRPIHHCIQHGSSMA